MKIRVREISTEVDDGNYQSSRFSGLDMHYKARRVNYRGLRYRVVIGRIQSWEVAVLRERGREIDFFLAPEIWHKIGLFEHMSLANLQRAYKGQHDWGVPLIKWEW